MKNKRSKEWLTKEEYNLLINHPHISRRDELIISLLYGCALRVSELCNLKIKDINTKKGTLVLWKYKRSNDPALVPIPISYIKLINQRIKEKKLKQHDFLISSQKGKGLSRTQVYRIIQKNGIKAGIPKKLTTHSLRRSRATHLLDSGLSIAKVSRLLRHKNLSSTMVYLRISIQSLQKDIYKIDEKDNNLNC